jgi:hypothetical protein
VVEYSGVQFTQTLGVLRGMGLGDLEKSEKALDALRTKDLAPE